jgi:excisionase family DNA binding protein
VIGVSGLVDAQEAGALLGVPKSWVLAQARKDAIPYVRLGHYVRFEPAVLEAWWQARRRGPVTRRGLAS